MGEVRKSEYIDAINGVDYVIANRNLDFDRMGIKGRFWGGVHVSYAITN